TGVYIITRPSFSALNQYIRHHFQNRNTKILFFSIAGIALISTFIFFPVIKRIKQEIHFSGEPVMEFVFGPMWDSNTLDYVYESSRIKNGIRDKACIESITTQPAPADTNIVVVILVDGLRKDMLPAYGYTRNNTPFLDSLQHTGRLSIVD